MQLAFLQVPLTSITSFCEEHTSKVGKAVIKQEETSESNTSKEFYGPWRLGWQERDATGETS